MKNIVEIISIFVCILLVISCTREEALQVTVDFSIDVFNDDFSIPVDVVIFNRTKGAETFEWSFEGGTPATSSVKNPGIIRYEQKGNYTIRLFATNADGSEDSKEINIQIDDPVAINFTANAITDNFPPAQVRIENNTTGGNSFKWTFEGGVPAASDAKDPGIVTFADPGDHKITLEASNGLETETLEQTITVAPNLIVDFDVEVAFEDDDFQIPANVIIQNTSVSATSYQWLFSGATITNATEENPEVTFNQSGRQTITLTATNGKETKSTFKEITLFENTNLRTFENMKLGINSSHTANITGAFFSINNRQVYTSQQTTPEVAPDIDLVFFALNSSFIQNRFVSPDRLDITTFPALSGAPHTKVINTLEDCNCSASLSVAQFDGMQDDTLLSGLTIEETPEGLQPFDDSIIPRIVLFQTQDGRKGAIKIKEYINDQNDAYILVDIKTQKE
ncbi:PKD domain-containing protein [Aquimarina gracilis]|uniref:PKD domain-containing protein n=1 Tax=Aquimarina gracilis TaxID=874422 RepID=A0ABU5ZZ49_9FLAO|nr:PKD domain-containing protein [Aquimarina gracilis]MEB3347103.1 PKD domain-containing protein [Aquimarina gracilis]